MVRATEAAGTQLMINWPTAWNPAIQELERRILAGDIGQLTYFKQRSAHNGPKEIGCDPHFWGWLYDEEKNGAGAFMDYCGYSADMCARFLGLPQQVTGFRERLRQGLPGSGRQRHDHDEICARLRCGRSELDADCGLRH
jgi:predicted dehydrogenase